MDSSFTAIRRGGVLGPLDIAAHPVERVGDPAQHLLAQHPGVLRAAALAGIHHQAAALERDAGQRAGHDLGFGAMQDEGAQIDMPRLDAVADKGRARWKAGWWAGRYNCPDRP